MMILKLIILGALVASQGSGSAIKGRAELQQQQQQLVEVKQEPLVGEELAKKSRHEARPQLKSEELAKAQQQHEEQSSHQELERVELDSQQVEQRDEQAPLPLPLAPAPIEQLRAEEPAAPVKGAHQPEAALLPAAEPYAFGYRVEGSSRSESGDSRGVVRGQYTLEGADGSSRVVDYVADHNGFRASVRTNEFGTEARSPASVALLSAQPPAEEITRRLETAPRLALAPAGLKEIHQEVALVRLAEQPLAVKSLPKAEEQQVPREQPEGSKKLAAKLVEAPLAGERKLAEPRSQFESATSHQQRARRPLPTSARSFVRRERYPPSPAQGVYRRHQVGVDPRVSFYAPPTIEELDLVGFAEQ